MEKNKVRHSVLVAAGVFCAATLPLACYAQSDALPRLGLGVQMSTLGAGIEAATAVTRKSNVRVAFNDFSYSRDFSKDGINYSGELTLRSFNVFYDQYLLGGFHVSPGLMLYNGNRGTATATVPGGQSFSLGGTTFYSSAADPVNGNGTLQLGSVSPIVLLGFGNLLPRSSRHFTVKFEFGAVFQGAPKTTLRLNGSTCDFSGRFCQAIAGNPTVQNSIQSEQTKINKDVDFFRYYPVISLGFGYKF